MSKAKLFSLFVTVMCICLILSGCSPNKQTEPPAPNGEDEPKLPVQNTDIVPDEPDVIPTVVSKFTGLDVDESLGNVRPVAIMINNIKKATPQQGISNADIMYEVLAEGGITRLLCLFSDYASLPETGSIRSSRDYFIDLSDAHDAIYVHCGGSPAAYDTLTARKTENIDGYYFNTPFYRNKERLKNMGTEHSLMTTGELLVSGISQKGYRTESNTEQPLKFEKADVFPDGEDALSADIKFSYYNTAEFDYNDKEGVYYKKQYGESHIDYVDENTKIPLSFKNIIVLYCDQGLVEGDEAGRLYLNFVGNGEGKYISNGKSCDIKWSRKSRTSSYNLFEEDGLTELMLSPGKTYIAILPKNTKLYNSSLTIE